MPAKSKKQRRMMAIAEHKPELLYEKNKVVLKMGKEKMHEFASTKEKGLPKKKMTPQKRFESKRKREGAKHH